MSPQRTVKCRGWAVLYSDEKGFQAAYDSRLQANLQDWRLSTQRVVPCTISYQLPKQKPKRKT